MSESAFERVKLARDNKRPTGLDYIKNIFKGFIEFHGDRRYADDPAIVGGIAKLDSTPVTVIAIEKGHTAKERTYRNFGMPQPEGYRKALRLMKQAEKFGRPIVCFVDTSGAYCGISAEERGQGQAIAENLLEMSTLCVPIISILIGRFGHKVKLVTYTTMSANLMLREVGLVLFLASVGIKAGENFVQMVVEGDGVLYVGLGFLITFIPLVITGIVARWHHRVNYFTLMGLIAGSNTDPPALAYANQIAGNDAPAVGYSTVYPLTMFLRILTAQLLVLLMAG